MCLFGFRLFYARGDRPQRVRDSGRHVHVYVVDSGISKLSTFEDRLIYETVGTGAGQEDNKDHGTRVASIIGSTSFGVARRPILHACKVDLPNGQPDHQVARKFIDSITKQHRQRCSLEEYKGTIINLSMDVSVEMKAAVESADAAGVVVVIAAGNNGAWLGELDRNNPCGWGESIITVGAIDKHYNLAQYLDSSDPQIRGSNYHQDMTIFASGKNVSGYDARGTVRHDLSGTSYACGKVSGIMATFLSLEKRPCSPSKAKKLLLLNADRGFIRGLPSFYKLPNLVANNGYGKSKGQPYLGYGMDEDVVDGMLQRLGRSF